MVLGVAIAGWIATCGTWQVQQVAGRVAPLDARSFVELTVVAVGTGGAYENPSRGGPATAIALGERIWLVDAGRAVAEGLRRAEIRVSQPERVLISSLLPDNVVGLDDLLLTGWLQGRSVPLELVGPPGTRVMAESIVASHRRGIDGQAESLGLPLSGARFEVTEITDGWSDERDGLTARVASLPGGPVEGLAYRFEAGGRSLVVGGGGWAPEELVELARGANLLIHEAVFVPGPELAKQMGLDDQEARLAQERKLHTGIHDVGDLARRAGVGTLALVRLRPPPVFDLQITSVVSDTFQGRIVIPSDGDELKP